VKHHSILIAVAVLLCSVVLSASPKETIIEGTPEEVFSAVLKVAQSNWVVTFADRPTGIISFNTGTSLTSNGMECSAWVQPQSDGRIQITVKTQKKNGQIIAWGVGDRIADKLFKGVIDELASSRAARPPGTPTLQDRPAK